MKKNEKYLIAALSLILVVLLVYSFQPNLKMTYAYLKAVYTLSDTEAILILDFDGQKEEGQRWFKGDVIEGMTLMHTLQAASIAGDFDLNANSHLAGIDGVDSNGDKQWICLLNDEPVRQNLSEIKISPKDKIFCQYR